MASTNNEKKLEEITSQINKLIAANDSADDNQLKELVKEKIRIYDKLLHELYKKVERNQKNARNTQGVNRSGTDLTRAKTLEIEQLKTIGLLDYLTEYGHLGGRSSHRKSRRSKKHSKKRSTVVHKHVNDSAVRKRSSNTAKARTKDTIQDPVTA